MHLWSEEFDSRSFLRRRHRKFTSESITIDWKNIVRDICGVYFLTRLEVIED